MTTWTTRDGTVLEIEEMDPRHARNCCRMLLRNAKDVVNRMALRALEDALSAAESSACARGDMATYYAEAESDQAWEVAIWLEKAAKTRRHALRVIVSTDKYKLLKQRAKCA